MGQWFPFHKNILRFVKPRPGLCVLFDDDEKIICIEGAENLYQCLERHLEEPNSVRIRIRAAMCHLVYRQDYRHQERIMRDAHQRAGGHVPNASDAQVF